MYSTRRRVALAGPALFLLALVREDVPVDGEGQRAQRTGWHRFHRDQSGTNMDHCVASRSAIPASSSSPAAGCQRARLSAAPGTVSARTRSLSRDGSVIVVAEPRDLPEADFKRFLRRNRNYAWVVDALAHREQRRAHPHRALEQRGAQVRQAPDLAAVRRENADVLRYASLGSGMGGGVSSAAGGRTGGRHTAAPLSW